jgi:hypothetical protein
LISNIIQRIVLSIEQIINKINEDMEPFNFNVSTSGIYSLHLIAQTYLIRIMQEIRKISEYAPYYTFIKNHKIQKELYIAKLTSNNQEMD